MADLIDIGWSASSEHDIHIVRGNTSRRLDQILVPGSDDGAWVDASTVP